MTDITCWIDRDIYAIPIRLQFCLDLSFPVFLCLHLCHLLSLTVSVPLFLPVSLSLSLFVSVSLSSQNDSTLLNAPIISCWFSHNPLWIVTLQASSSKGHGKPLLLTVLVCFPNLYIFSSTPCCTHGWNNIPVFFLQFQAFFFFVKAYGHWHCKIDRWQSTQQSSLSRSSTWP